MRGAFPALGIMVSLLAVAGCSDAGGKASDPPVASAPSVPATPPPSAAEESPFLACLRRHGVRLPEDERPGGDEQRMLRGVEKCASVLDLGRPVRMPVTKGDRFQACLAEHGVELPDPGRWLVLERGKNRTMDAALRQC